MEDQDPIIKWLLEPKNPTIRYYTLLNLLDYSKKSPEVQEIRNQIQHERCVQKILQRQNSDGSWGNPTTPYSPKYKATYWQIMILAMLGLDRSNSAIERAVDYIWQFQRSDGAFATYGEQGAEIEYDLWATRTQNRGKIPQNRQKKIAQMLHENELTCLTGNIATALLNLGYNADHPRVKKAIDWLVTVQNPDGGWLCPYWGAHKNDTHGCFMGTITPLDAFSRIPPNHRSSELQISIEKGAEFLLIHQLYKADHHDGKIINPHWLNLSFPCFFYDILRAVEVLGRLEKFKDPRIIPALEILKQKQQPSGVWLLEASPSGMWSTIEKKGEASKWITMKVLSIQKQLK